MLPQRDVWVADSLAELTEGADERIEVRPGDARSGSGFEKLTVDGERYFLKTVSPAGDWIMRVTGDIDHRTFRIWKAGLMSEAPDCIDHTVVGMALDGEGPDAVLGILMRDVAEHLVPEGDAVLPTEQHEGFLDHMAALYAHFWGWRDTLGLATLEQRLRFFAPDNIAVELTAEDVPGPLAAADEGWRLLAERAPDLWRTAERFHTDPAPLTDAFRRTPQTFLHGDWKAGNLGRRPDGRTILLDWAYPGEGPACWDLAWYLALNRARLPETKEAAIERFRVALEHHGIPTGEWWTEQLELCLLGMAVCFGWEKALGDDDELRWWAERAAQGVRRLDETHEA